MQKYLDKEKLAYSIGGLLYMPALRTDIVEVIVTKKYSDLMSVAICLEDSIQDDCVEAAEKNLCKIVSELKAQIRRDGNFFTKEDLPNIFVRVRSAEHLKHVHDLLVRTDGDYDSVVRGYLLPKFDTTNMCEYFDVLDQVNRERSLFALPILESRQLIDERTSVVCLGQIKEKFDERDYVLGVRVGGNDFCNAYGLRRGIDQTIYDIAVVSRALCNIVNIFGRDYVVSGPVWEFFDNGSDDKWKAGLERELAQDRVNGFIGKTVIHPSQLSVVKNSLKVSRCDYADALGILENATEGLGVSKSANGRRMNEIKTHQNWAKRIKMLAEVWGLKD